jgi:hypothetical protein
MASFTVEHKTTMSKDEAFKKVQTYFKESEGIKKLDSNLECAFDDANYSGSVKGSKFQCEFKFSGSDPTTVTIQVNLAFLLTPFKGKIQETLKSKMGQLLG